MTTYESIISLAQARHQPARIADRLGLSRETVYNYISRARREGHHIPHFGQRQTEPRVGRVVVSTKVLRRLQSEAGTRGITAGELATRLLEHVIQDDLVDAILDDEVSNG
ncbi:helix-turn-helix domain-containing protein [Oceanicola sp. S124]|uniref:helix-turn-helix domain-containing protein n=1 Tax=Oceanicola sp. S124 TaxID=1042378 RepID=UPI000255864D|nr:helix-turn-helix domain-containing protein [Oceanicola sp. S124]